MSRAIEGKQILLRIGWLRCNLRFECLLVLNHGEIWLSGLFEHRNLLRLHYWLARSVLASAKHLLLCLILSVRLKYKRRRSWVAKSLLNRWIDRWWTVAAHWVLVKPTRLLLLIYWRENLLLLIYWRESLLPLIYWRECILLIIDLSLILPSQLFVFFLESPLPLRKVLSSLLKILFHLCSYALFEFVSPIRIIL